MDPMKMESFTSICMYSVDMSQKKPSVTGTYHIDSACGYILCAYDICYIYIKFYINIDV